MTVAVLSGGTSQFKEKLAMVPLQQLQGNYMILKNLQRYFPEVMQHGDDIQYFIDADGKDWFDSLPLFTKPHAIAFHPDTGEIYSYCDDVSRIYPVGLNVTDIDSVPADFEMGITPWIFDGEKVVKMPIDYVQIASNRRDDEMVAATARINALVEAQEDGDITPEEEAELTALRERRTKLRRLDLSTAPAIEWP